MTAPALEPMTLVYHELRSPLGLLATAARAAAEDCEDEDLKKRCEVIVRAAERMLRSAQQVFDLARATSAPTTATFSPTDVIMTIATDMTELGTPVDTIITASARRAWANANREIFEALVQSLISNATDHGDSRFPPVVQAAVEDAHLVIEVRNRVGAPEQHEGLGLGSFIARGLASAVGARFAVVESPDEYVVRLFLPRTERQADN